MSISLKIYVSIARPGHWVKHIFIIPGIVGALILIKDIDDNVLIRLIIGFVSACVISSANYVINEWLDSEFDQHHPLKCQRPGAQGLLSRKIVILEYILLAFFGLFLAFTVNKLFLFSSCLFLVSGIFYNVKPLRTKDNPYLDVITEAINNPIRLILGWAMVSGVTIPPLSLIGTYWLGGAFLMSAKRLSEYRFIVTTNGPDAPGNYRKSFKHYTELSLLISCFVYAILASFLLAVFLLKYRTEYILTFPLFTMLFSYYLHMSMNPASAAQRPEKLHKDKVLIIILFFLFSALTILSFKNIPFIESVIQSRFTDINFK